MKKLRDPEEDIRIKAVTNIVDITLQNPLFFKKEVLSEVGDRAKDKKIEVRKITLIGLAKIYNKFVCTSFSPFSDFIGKSTSAFFVTSQEEFLERFSFIPGIIINSWGFPEFSSKCLIIKLLQEQILPKFSDSVSRLSLNDSLSAHDCSLSSSEFESCNESKTSDLRATSLIYMFQNLNQSERVVFSSILSYKASTRSSLVKYINDIQEYKKIDYNKQDKVKKLKGEIKKNLFKLNQLIPYLERRSNSLENLQQIK